MEVAICALDQPSDGKVTSRKGQNIPFDLLLMAHERGPRFSNTGETHSSSRIDSRDLEICSEASADDCFPAKRSIHPAQAHGLSFPPCCDNQGID
jgi:hypothetical protein